MPQFESLGSCMDYLTGMATIKVSLPRKAPYCQYCPHISYQQAYDRHSCRITGEWILNYKKERGEQCPFDWEEDNNG